MTYSQNMLESATMETRRFLLDRISSVCEAGNALEPLYSNLRELQEEILDVLSYIENSRNLGSDLSENDDIRSLFVDFDAGQIDLEWFLNTHQYDKAASDILDTYYNFAQDQADDRLIVAAHYKDILFDLLSQNSHFIELSDLPISKQISPLTCPDLPVDKDCAVVCKRLFGTHKLPDLSVLADQLTIHGTRKLQRHPWTPPSLIIRTMIDKLFQILEDLLTYYTDLNYEFGEYLNTAKKLVNKSIPSFQSTISACSEDELIELSEYLFSEALKVEDRLLVCFEDLMSPLSSALNQ